MPELPEVEVVKKSLTNSLIKSRLLKIIIKDKNLRYKLKSEDFKKIKDTQISNIKRRAKYLLINFNNDMVMLAHLGMTGKFLLKNKSDKEIKTGFHDSNKRLKKHDHVIFFFNKKLNLIYNDVRKFGFIKIISSNDLSKNKHLINLGPEPLSKKFNKKYVKKFIENKNVSIKNLLMNQKFVSGLGNIYTNEILFKSKLNPRLNINKISESKINALVKSTKSILRKSITKGGSSIKDFQSSYGKKGTFQDNFSVYDKKNQNCSNYNCKGFIKKIILNNRASYYCNLCQK